MPSSGIELSTLRSLDIVIASLYGKLLNNVIERCFEIFVTCFYLSSLVDLFSLALRLDIIVDAGTTFMENCP